MKTSLNQRGIGHLAVLLLVVVAVAIAAVGYRVSSTTQSDSTDVATSSVPASFKTKGDVSQASKALDDTDVDSAVDPDQLDSDLKELF